MAGEATIESFFHGDDTFEYSPIVLMQALLVQTWRPFGANGRDPAVGWALGTIVPEFDDFARPIKRRINHSAVAALPFSFRPALLAGVSRVLVDPVLLKSARDETLLRGRSAFERLARPLGWKPKNRGKAIKCENILRQHSHIQWLFWRDVRYSHAKVVPDSESISRDALDRAVGKADGVTRPL